MVSQARLDRLWKHLLLVEEKTGKRLRKTLRYSKIECPIENFAPGRDENGATFLRVSTWGYLRYVTKSAFCDYTIYECEDSEWWDNLPLDEKRFVTRWVMKKIAERNNEN